MIKGRKSKPYQYYYYKGAIHIHSKYSDGTGSLNQIVRAGLKSKLDYLIITDHNNIKLKTDGKDGWYDNRLFVMIGEEVSHSDQHLLALGIDEKIPKNLRPQESSLEIKKNEGMSIVAHPDGKYQFHFRKRDYSWKYWDQDSFDGIEIWSYMFDWVKNIKPWNLPYYFVNRNEAIEGPQQKTLSRWDYLNKKRRVVGIGGIDAHAKGIWPFQVFPYHKLFKTVVTYAVTSDKLSTDNKIAQEQLLKNLKDGSCFFAFEEYAHAKGFQFFIEVPNKRLEMGNRENFDSDSNLHLIFPKRCSYRIIKNGKHFFAGIGKTWNMKINTPGVYRVEASYNNKPWIFSNPIVLTDI